MRMRRRSEAFPHVFASYSFARMGASEGSGASETGRTHERDTSIDARWRPRPDTQIYVRRSSSV
jgi:hypothetical protein